MEQDQEEQDQEQEEDKADVKMAVFMSPRFNQRFVRDRFNTDIIIESESASDALKNEDVLVVGNWEAYTGSATVTDSQVRFAGVPNELQMSRAGIMGEEEQQLTRRGNSSQMYRTRKYLEYLNFK